MNLHDNFDDYNYTILQILQSSQSSNDEFCNDDMDTFDSIVSTMDVNEAAKRCHSHSTE